MTQPNPPKPQPPVFETQAEERRYRKHRLAATLRLFSKYGFQEGVMGHVSVRDPEHTDHYWTNPYATDFGSITPDDLVLYNFKGEIVEGKNRFIHVGGTLIHIPILETRPDVISVAHTHAVHGRAWSTLGRLLDPISAESAQFYGRHEIYDTYRHGEGYSLARAIGKNRALLLKNHGVVTVGQSVDEAAYLFIAFERAAQAQLLAEAIGKPESIDAVHASAIAERATAQFAWLNFQPLLQGIVRENLDLAC
ncbi:MAG: class II aldolase/adducin family protein [Janthinobacterium lividum]